MNWKKPIKYVHGCTGSVDIVWSWDSNDYELLLM